MHQTPLTSLAPQGEDARFFDNNQTIAWWEPPGMVAQQVEQLPITPALQSEFSQCRRPLQALYSLNNTGGPEAWYAVDNAGQWYVTDSDSGLAQACPANNGRPWPEESALYGPGELTGLWLTLVEDYLGDHGIRLATEP